MMPDSLTRLPVNGQEADQTSELVPALAEHGLALLDNVSDPDSLMQVARSIATIRPHRDSDETGLTKITDIGGQIRTGFAGFSTCALNPHTDRSGVARPPVLLMMSCERPADSGGECVIVDGKAVYDDLAESNPKALRALSCPRSALFGGTAGHVGSIFTRVGERVTVRLRLDALAQFSPEVTHWLPLLRATIERHARTFSLDAGQGYILDNYRWLHGRRAFSGQRIMYRVTGDPGPGLRLTTGSRPGLLRQEHVDDLLES